MHSHANVSVQSMGIHQSKQLFVDKRGVKHLLGSIPANALNFFSPVQVQ